MSSTENSSVTKNSKRRFRKSDRKQYTISLGESSAAAECYRRFIEFKETVAKRLKLTQPELLDYMIEAAR